MGHHVGTLLRRLGLGGPPDGGLPDGTGRAVAEPRRDAGARVPGRDAQAALDALLDGLPPARLAAVRAAVRDPVRLLGRAGRQCDGTTCGSAVLVMLAAVGDPFLAAWLAGGRVPGGAYRPPELAGAPEARLAALAGAPPAARFAPLQRAVKVRTNARGVLGVLPWPAALGTPPWGAAAQARYPGVRYRAAVVDDADATALDTVLGRVADAVAAGVPVPLLSGGDTSTGLSTAVPRHVVLAVGGTAERLRVWEPSSGRVHGLARADLGPGAGGPRPALGGWSRLVWAVLPQAAPSAG